MHKVYRWPRPFLSCVAQCECGTAAHQTELQCHRLHVPDRDMSKHETWFLSLVVCKLPGVDDDDDDESGGCEVLHIYLS